MLCYSRLGTEALFTDLAALRMFRLFSGDQSGLVPHPFRGRLQIYTGSPMLGKPPTKPPPTAVNNRHYYRIR